MGGRGCQLQFPRQAKSKITLLITCLACLGNGWRVHLPKKSQGISKFLRSKEATRTAPTGASPLAAAGSAPMSVEDFFDPGSTFSLGSTKATRLAPAGAPPMAAAGEASAPVEEPVGSREATKTAPTGVSPLAVAGSAPMSVEDFFNPGRFGSTEATRAAPDVEDFFNPESAFNTRAGPAGAQAISAAGEAPIPIEENPLLMNAGLPHFNIIEPKHVEPAVNFLIASLRDDFSKLKSEMATKTASYEGVVEALEKIRYPLEYSWNVISHLQTVKNSEPLRNAHQATEPEVVKVFMELEQSRDVYDALAKLDSAQLSTSQQHIIDSKLRSMRLSGVHLTDETKDEFNKIAMKLSDLGTQFDNNLLDSTKAFEIIIKNPADVDGLPPTALSLAAQSYTQAKPDEPAATAEAGPWRLTLDSPSYIPAMKNLKSSELRKRLWSAFSTRAAKGNQDNRPIALEILKLRQQISKILGFASWADLSLASKMAENVAAVENLTEQLFVVAKPAAQREFAELFKFKNSKGYVGYVKFWDILFWSERLKEERYAYDEEALRPYLSLPKVLEGMFGIASKLFGVKILRDDEAAGRWHPDVMFFRVFDEALDDCIASFFLDPYARPEEKRGGAWHAIATGRSKALNKKPVSYLNCNGSPPVGETPSLMTFADATILFHEFGHGLQHMLTHVDEGDAAGYNNVEWDAVELPSQFMENWLYHKPTVDSFAVHYETGEPLPTDVFKKIKGAQTFQNGLSTLDQLHMAAVDMELHKGYLGKNGEGAFDVSRCLADKYGAGIVETWDWLLDSGGPPDIGDANLCTFHHIFCLPPYSAGYYSYKWAQVLSADAFAAFEEAGLDNDEVLAVTGRRFRETVLGRGGSQAAAEVYRDFRGKNATVDALLRHSGLLAEA